MKSKLYLTTIRQMREIPTTVRLDRDAFKDKRKSGEKFVVNGAVMVAGSKGASLVLQNEATILPGKDVMQEKEATTLVVSTFRF